MPDVDELVVNLVQLCFVFHEEARPCFKGGFAYRAVRGLHILEQTVIVADLTVELDLAACRKRLIFAAQPVFLLHEGDECGRHAFDVDLLVGDELPAEPLLDLRAEGGGEKRFGILQRKRGKNGGGLIEKFLFCLIERVFRVEGEADLCKRAHRHQVFSEGGVFFDDGGGFFKGFCRLHCGGQRGDLFPHCVKVGPLVFVVLKFACHGDILQYIICPVQDHPWREAYPRRLLPRASRCPVQTGRRGAQA